MWREDTWRSRWRIVFREYSCPDTDGFSLQQLFYWKCGCVELKSLSLSLRRDSHQQVCDELNTPSVLADDMVIGIFGCIGYYITSHLYLPSFKSPEIFIGSSIVPFVVGDLIAWCISKSINEVGTKIWFNVISDKACWGFPVLRPGGEVTNQVKGRNCYKEKENKINFVKAWDIQSKECRHCQVYLYYPASSKFALLPWVECARAIICIHSLKIIPSTSQMYGEILFPTNLVLVMICKQEWTVIQVR